MGPIPAFLRMLMTIGFPVVISTQVTIPEQRVGVDKYKRKFVLSRVHPEDRDLVQQQIERASRDGDGFDFERRLQLPDRYIKQCPCKRTPVAGLAPATSNL